MKFKKDSIPLTTTSFSFPATERYKLYEIARKYGTLGNAIMALVRREWEIEQKKDDSQLKTKKKMDIPYVNSVIAACGNDYRDDLVSLSRVDLMPITIHLARLRRERDEKIERKAKRIADTKGLPVEIGDY